MKTMYIDQAGKQVVTVEWNKDRTLCMAEVEPILPEHNGFKTHDVESVILDPCEIDLSAIDKPAHEPRMPFHIAASELQKAAECFEADERIRFNVVVSAETCALMFVLTSDKRKVYIF